MFSPLEAEIMRILWQEGSATVRKVHETLQTQGSRLAYTTVMTVMVRLYEKGFLRRVKEGKGYRYFPIHARETIVRRVINTFLDHLVALFGEPAVSYLMEEVQKRRR